ncbi:MAG TPA: glutamate racemase [Thermoanaerobaculia bacterium]
MTGPIGVFDSGVGGLTVFQEIERALPSESLVYLGDSARVPYGTKSPETVTRYSMEAAAHLLERGIKALVVACNTATAASLPQLRQRLPIPVVGVIEPGARAAAAATKGRVGVIATEATVRSRAYSAAIAAIEPSIQVWEQACPLFVPLAEEGWANTRVAQEVAEIYLAPLLDAGIDTLVLGCTHYPILKATIRKVTGDALTIVDSAETTAASLAAVLAEGALNAPEGTIAHQRFLVTDGAERFQRVAEEFLDRRVTEVEIVSIDGARISA